MKLLLLLLIITGGGLTSSYVQPHINRIKVIEHGEYCDCLYYYGVDSLTMGMFYSPCDVYNVGDVPPTHHKSVAVAEIK